MDKLMLLIDTYPGFLAVALGVGLWCAYGVSELPRRIYAQYASDALGDLPPTSSGLRVFMVLANGGVWFLCAWHWGPSLTAMCWASFFSALLTLTVIDLRTLLLPDLITQPLLWAGLLASNYNAVSLSLPDAVLGAAVGYVSLWTVAYLFERITGQEGMGAGDFKLMGALGAWLGPLALLPLALIASSLCATAALVMMWAKRSPEDGHLPFGPCLAAGGATMALWGEPITALLLG
jgi:leader peptidase (prepilin peptidase)/N-methyltransferase